MDKKNLYYIITAGTDSRVRNDIEEPVTFLSNHVDRFVELAETKYKDSYRKTEFIKITVEEYERIFGVDN